MRDELGAGVKADGTGLRDILGCLEHDEPRRLHSGLFALPAPEFDGPEGVREERSPVDRQKRAALDADVPGIPKALDQPPDVREVVFLTERLLHEHFVHGVLPSSVPALVRPAQCEGKVGVPRREHLLERTLEHALPAEPVVVIKKPRDPMLPGQSRLEVPGLGDPQIVEPELTRKVRLPVPGVQRIASRDDVPLRESIAVPGVVLGDLVELRQIEGQYLRPQFGAIVLLGRAFRHSLGPPSSSSREACHGRAAAIPTPSSSSWPRGTSRQRRRAPRSTPLYCVRDRTHALRVP